ncbi:molecular chaperone HtpG [Chloroflexota bacterium]
MAQDKKTGKPKKEGETKKTARSKKTVKAESFTFKAETRQLLNILIHSLYKEREVFLRELLSNASDALNRIRFELLTNRDVLDADSELKIHINVDKKKKLLIISDNGIGMTREEIIENLGTIAQSGAREFIKKASEAPKGSEHDLIQVIGQFGVGFYSVFMVAEWVRVTSRSFQPVADAVSWYAVGDDDFQISPAEKTDRGTTIEIKLKDDAAEFLEEFRLKQVIKRHSDYIGYPIMVGDEEEQVNKQTSIWRSSKKDTSTEQYKDFYRQLTLDFEDPLHHLQMTTDAPMQVYALLYIPSRINQGMLSLRKDHGLKLYSRNILIDEYSKDLLPEYLRFVEGVVDSEDLPLNVSRETIQATNLIAKLNKVITSQVLKELNGISRKNKDKYEKFWQEFGMFIKQGIASEQTDGEKLHSLLRFKTSTHPDEWSSLEDYIQRLKTDQKAIYYIVGDDPKSILRSPHLDLFRSRQVEVILFTEPMDSFMLMAMRKYKDFDLKNAASEGDDLPEGSETLETQKDPLPDEQIKTLVDLFKGGLGDRVSDVRSTDRLTESVARLMDPEGSLEPEMQRVYKYLEKDYKIPKKVLELNPRHEILRKLIILQNDAELQNALVEQIYESALLVEGLHPDPASMVSRLEQIMTAALKGSTQSLDKNGSSPLGESDN